MEEWKAVVFSDGRSRFTVTRQQMQEVMAAWETNHLGVIIAGLDKFVAAVMATTQEEEDGMVR